MRAKCGCGNAACLYLGEGWGLLPVAQLVVKLVVKLVELIVTTLLKPVKARATQGPITTGGAGEPTFI